jgi:hypothetical protein
MIQCGGAGLKFTSARTVVNTHAALQLPIGLSGSGTNNRIGQDGVVHVYMPRATQYIEDHIRELCQAGPQSLKACSA